MSQLILSLKLRLFVTILVLIFANSVCFSQNLEEEFSDFQKEIEEDYKQSLENNENEFKDFILNVNNEFYKFMRDADKEFSEFLRQEWIEINSFSYNDFDKSRKPKTEKEYSDEYMAIQNYIPKKNLDFTPINNDWLNTTLSFQNEKKDAVFEMHEFIFFGAALSISYNPDIFSGNYSKIDNKEIANFWETTSNSNYSKTISELYDIKERLNLNDWGFYKLVDKLFSELLVAETNKSQLYTWFYLNKAGYDAKLGVNEDSLYLMLAARNIVYSIPFFELNNTKYIILNAKPERIRTYPSIIKPGKSFSFYQHTPFNFPINSGQKRINFHFDSEEYAFKIPYNKNLVDFYKDYPLTELSVYANSFLSSEARNYLISVIQPIIENFPVEKKIDFLNKFVQQTSEYKTDYNQFGREKHFFPEESLFYKFSDCEDRSILLSFLFRELLNIRSIGADFEGHLIIGIPSKFTSFVSNLSYNNIEYVLLDPTYIGAPAGIISPDISVINPTVIEMFRQEHYNSGNTLIDTLMSNCVVEDIYTNKTGDIYYAGSVIKELKIQNIHLIPELNNSNTFLIKQDQKYQLKVLSPIQNAGDYQLHNVAEDNTGNLYILGSFIDSLIIGKNKLYSSEGDMFLLKQDGDEQVEWVEKLHIAIISDSLSYFTSIYNSKGELQYLAEQNNYNKQNAFQIEFDPMGNCIVQGTTSFSGKMSIDTVFFESGNTFEIVDWLIKENSRLIKAKFNPDVSPFFAIANMVSSSNIKLSGFLIQSALKEMSKDNVKKDEQYLQNLLNIESISREQSFITITTKNEIPVKLQNIEIANNARLKIAEEDFESRMLIYSGVKWEHASIWHKVNYILIHKNTGEILYDYDQNYRSKIPARQLTIQ